MASRDVSHHHQVKAAHCQMRQTVEPDQGRRGMRLQIASTE